MAAPVIVTFILAVSLSLGLVLAEGSDSDRCRFPSLAEVVFPSLREDKCKVTHPHALNPTRVNQLDELERALDFLLYNNAYTAVLFHASWCPFSKTCRSLFDVLSSLFPNMYHVAVEDSAVMPSVLSRYGVHSFPSLFLQNQTSRVRYHGSRDLESLVLFYKEITGIEPIIADHLAKDYGSSFRSHFSNDYSQSKEHSPYPWEMSAEKLIQQEPYLIFALLFLTMRFLVFILPKVLTRIKQYQLEHMWHINLALLSENTSPFLKHALHTINVNRIWRRLKLSKTRNFQEGAKNARVWASSLASVSLGKVPVNGPGSSSESR